MCRRSSKPDPPKAAHSHVWSLFGWMIPPSACLAWLKRFSGFCVLTEHVCVAVFPGRQSAGPSGSQPAPGRLVLVTMLPCNPFERLHEGTVCRCRLDPLPYKSNLLYNNIKEKTQTITSMLICLTQCIRSDLTCGFCMNLLTLIHQVFKCLFDIGVGIAE